jgi:ribosomal protein L15
MKSLVEKGIIDKNQIKLGAKILASGSLKKKLIIKVGLSKSARKIIEKIGGSI